VQAAVPVLSPEPGLLEDFFATGEYAAKRRRFGRKKKRTHGAAASTAGPAFPSAVQASGQAPRTDPSRQDGSPGTPDQAFLTDRSHPNNAVSPYVAPSSQEPPRPYPPPGSYGSSGPYVPVRPYGATNPYAPPSSYSSPGAYDAPYGGPGADELSSPYGPVGGYGPSGVGLGMGAGGAAGPYDPPGSYSPPGPYDAPYGGPGADEPSSPYGPVGGYGPSGVDLGMGADGPAGPYDPPSPSTPPGPRASPSPGVFRSTPPAGDPPPLPGDADATVADAALDAAATVADPAIEDPARPSMSAADLTMTDGAVEDVAEAAPSDLNVIDGMVETSATDLTIADGLPKLSATITPFNGTAVRPDPDASGPADPAAIEDADPDFTAPDAAVSGPVDSVSVVDAYADFTAPDEAPPGAGPEPVTDAGSPDVSSAVPAAPVAPMPIGAPVTTGPLVPPSLPPAGKPDGQRGTSGPRPWVYALIGAAAASVMLTGGGMLVFGRSTLVGSVTHSGCTTCPSPPAKKPAAVRPVGPPLIYRTVDREVGYFEGTVTLVNRGKTPLRAWTLTFTYPGANIHNAWDVLLKQKGENVVITNAATAQPIAPGDSFEVRFGGAGRPATPTNCVLNGLSCAFAVR
jgi:hypothetical protein